MAVRAIYGSTASFGWSRLVPCPRRRLPGRRYFIHVVDELSPLCVKLYADDDLEQLQRKHGDRWECVIAEQMVQVDLDQGWPLELPPLSHSNWVTP